MVTEAADLKVLLPAYTEPPPIVTGPVKLAPLVRVSALDPILTRGPGPLIVPGPVMVKLLALELRVVMLGETVPLTNTVVGAPSVSSNNTRSLVLNTVAWLLLTLIQFAEVPVSQTALFAMSRHLSEFPTGNTVRSAESLLVVPLLLPTTTL